MIGIAQHTFKQQPGVIQFFGICLTCSRQRLDEPKRAHVESPFLARQSVDIAVPRIAMHKAVADETSMAGTCKDSVYGAEHPRISRSHEEHERHNKERRVQVLAAVKLRKRVALLVPALGHYFFVDTIPFAYPLSAVGGKCTLVGQPQTAIQGYPVHDF